MCAFPGKGLGGLQSPRVAESSQKRCSFLEIGRAWRGAQEFPRLFYPLVLSRHSLDDESTSNTKFLSLHPGGRLGLCRSSVRRQGSLYERRSCSIRGLPLLRVILHLCTKRETASWSIFSLKYDLATWSNAFAKKICIKRSLGVAAFQREENLPRGRKRRGRTRGTFKFRSNFARPGLVLNSSSLLAFSETSVARANNLREPERELNRTLHYNYILYRCYLPRATSRFTISNGCKKVPRLYQRSAPRSIFTATILSRP